MNKKELIERIEGLKKIFGNKVKYIEIDAMIELVSKLDEPDIGHADEAPRYLKNILARLRELPVHDRGVWLKAIMSEFEQEFCLAKWREGYEQGKLEGMAEREKVKVPQFVADWLSNLKSGLFGLNYDSVSSEIYDWVYDTEDNLGKLHLAFVYGYEVEEEKKFKIKLLNRNDRDLYLVNQNANLADKYGHFSPVVLLFTKSTFFSEKCYKLTKKEVVSNGFGWVFDCEGIEVEEVKD